MTTGSALIIGYLCPFKFLQICCVISHQLVFVLLLDRRHRPYFPNLKVLINMGVYRRLFKQTHADHDPNILLLRRYQHHRRPERSRPVLVPIHAHHLNVSSWPIFRLEPRFL